MSDVRRDFIKHYLVLLWGDQEFRGLRSPLAIAKKATQVFARDVFAAAGDLGVLVAEQQIGSATGVVADWARGKLADIKARGIGQVLKEVKAQYDEGAENLHDQRRK